MPGDTITKSEIKDVIKEGGLKPSDLFSNDALTSDPFIEGYVADERKAASSGEYAHRKRTDDKFDTDRKVWEDEKKKLEDENKALKTDGAKIKASDLFVAKIKERKLDKQQSKFIETKQKDFSPEDIENLDKEVDKFMDNAVEEYKETAKIFGVKTEEKNEKEPEPGSPPGEEGEVADNSMIPD